MLLCALSKQLTALPEHMQGERNLALPFSVPQMRFVAQQRARGEFLHSSFDA